MPHIGVQMRELWSDLHHEFLVDSNGRIKKVINIEAVKTSVHNILCTRQGERVMLPEFASNLSDIIFEPITDDLINFLSRDIKNIIERWDNRVSVDGVDFFADPDRSYLELDIRINIVGYPQIFRVKFTVPTN